jgi:outer membrane protein TolC
MFSTPSQAMPAKASDLVRMAVDRNPDIQRAQLNWKVQKLEKINRYYRFFPNLVFQTKGGLDAKSQSGQGSPYTSQYTFSIQDTLYSPDANYWTYREGDLGERMASTQFIQGRDQQILTVIQRIYDFLDLDYQLEVQRQELKSVEIEYHLIEHSYHQGLKAYSDFLRFKGRYLSVEVAVQNLEIERKKSLIDIRSLLELEGELGPVEDDLANLGRSSAAIKERGQLISDLLLDDLTELAKVRTEIVRTKYPFEIDVNLGANYTQNDYLRGLPWIRTEGPWESFGLLSFKWQVWDWGFSRRTVSQEQARQEQTVLSQKLLRTQSHGRFDQLGADIGKLETQMGMLAEIVRVESEDLKQQTLNYRTGKATFLDYSGALTNFGQARQALRQSELRLKRFRAEALSLKGQLYEQIFSK